VRRRPRSARPPSPCELDVTRQESIDSAVAETVAALGQIDILINNAAIFTAAPLVEIERADYQRVSTSTSPARCSPCRPWRGT
jgi:NAD(P)-dependent dehydrogenase (short-subunit alcohol dehydrogenase family)